MFTPGASARPRYCSPWDDIFIAMTHERSFNTDMYLALPILSRLFFVDELCSHRLGGREDMLVLKKSDEVGP